MAIPLLFAACGTEQAITDDPRNDTDSSTIDGVTGGNGVVGVSGIEPGTLVAIATPPFCCDPLERTFSALLDSRELPAGSRCRWVFGDGFAKNDCVAVHTFRWSGQYRVLLEVTLPNGKQLSAEMHLQVGREYGEIVTSVGNATLAESILVDAGSDLIAASGERVQLAAEVTVVPYKAQVFVQWRQLSGPVVMLDGAATLFPTFLVPPAQAGTVLRFEVTADSGGLMTMSTVAVQVLGVITVLAGEPDFKNPAAVQSVLDGKTETANAAWWGFDPSDSTAAIQSAIDSGARRVIIPFMGSDWVVGPIFLTSNQDLLFDPRVVVAAKEGSFHGLYDSLFTASRIENVKIIGNDALLRMRKSDYVKDDYERSEWRHALALLGAKDVEVRNLRLHSSGGDGIYIGASRDQPRIHSENILISGCECHDNYRQGISIVSGANVLVEDCALHNTSGTAPQAGIDVEPSFSSDIVSNVEIRNCIADHNSGSGFFTNLSKLNASSAPVSLRFVNCIVRNSYQPGLRVILTAGGSATGSVEYIDCTSEAIGYSGAFVRWNSAASIKLAFRNCKWRNVARKADEPPIYIQMENAHLENTAVEFENCYLYDERPRDPIRGLVEGGTLSRAVKGTIHYNNPVAASVSLRPQQFPDLSVVVEGTEEGTSEP